LRTKEFLGKHQIPFLSRNVLTDEGALEELLALGTRQLPVIARGKDWVNGQSLKEIAWLVGIDLGIIRHLPPAELVRRIDVVVDGASRFFAQIPEDHLDDQLPGRPRSYAQLAWHLFNVVDAFLEHEEGIALQATAYNRVPSPGTPGQQSRSIPTAAPTVQSRTAWASSLTVPRKRCRRSRRRSSRSPAERTRW